MIIVDKHDAVTLKISTEMSESKKLDLDAYLFIPGELGLTPEVMSESEFFYSSIHQKRSYYSDKILLPLVHSRLAQRGRLSSAQYRVSLSLFAYQYVIALDRAVSQLNSTSDTVTPDEVDTVIELSLDILKRLRRTIPYEESIKRYYANIDNYLSWYTEQKFLSIIAHLTRDSDYKTIKERLITLVEKEQAHRALNHYNSAKADTDITRLSNKMRLLRRLIEHPIILNEKVTSLGNNMKRAVKGIATGLIMVVVTITAISARDYWGEITASFIIAMSFIYALREIFKDDLRDILWCWIRKGKPKWRRRYFDPSTGKQVGQKDEWLDYRSLSTLPEKIQNIRKKRVVQREEQILHYRSEVEMSTSRFMSGYEETRESLMIDLRPITRLMDKGSNRIYQLNNGQVSRESVEKRHLINLIVRENDHQHPPTYYRWKIVLNRSKIVDIESIVLD
ncbi:hypothetical protein EXA21_10225 [Vibrio cincinnatiensis]|uniref:hypothetical protein n=1 Tax=Vibrio cincinnatiensis TaxID=675 RepID=UPI001EDD7E72|nr:hypothetical protein [Vibrio cincinnatiensis]MCG3759972.1 hypothetical protein [Vibrio cincinnatiensis]MCG3763249.1 hypothetical protein [Vibrio cincinnatiensis]